MDDRRDDRPQHPAPSRDDISPAGRDRRDLPAPDGTAQSATVAAAGATSVVAPGQPMPPIAAVRPQTRVFGSVEVADPYAWLEDPTNPETIAYLDAENAYREAVMAPTRPFQQGLYAEILARIKETDVSVPTPFGEWFYYRRTEEGLQYPIFARKRGTLDAPEEVLLDLNAMVGESGYVRLTAYEPSPDHRYLAYSLNETGGIEATLFVKDLRTGTVLPERVSPVQGVVWANDNRTLFYVKQDAALRGFELYRHALGDDPTSDPLLYREEDEVFSIHPSRSKDGAYLFLGSFSPETSEVRYLSADRPDAEWTVFAPRREGIIYSLEHLGDDFLVLTDEDAPNAKLLAVPVADPAPANRRELVPHRPDVLLQGLDPYEGYLVIAGREAGLTKLWVRERASGATRSLPFEEAVYTVSPGENRTFATTTFRFRYTSPVTPTSVFEEDLATGVRTLLKREEVLGGHDPERYVSERLVATAEDGAAVPITLVRRRDAGEGPWRLLLEGYGSYGYSYDPSFDSTRLSLLDRGVAYAIAHVRGGQELGRRWYKEGKLLAKTNTFTDFVAVAEHLVARGHTAPDRLIAQGGSAGGLLMGAVANARPDLFRAIVAQVPFVDVLRVMLDPSLPLTTGEFEEWGNPSDPAFYEYIASYSPYDNVAAQAYPELLITGGIEDDQVPYWQPAKWAAKLRATKTDDNPLLVRMNMGAGHGGASGRYDRYREVAHDLTFVLRAMGVPLTVPAGAAPGGPASPPSPDIRPAARGR